ncbi:MAG TPA: ComEC family competence protein, partial [Candidatus Omnitrophica bacterium]|nr:ComEC family competence protein [Candidatus Omnitrophota bacterium]
CYVSFFFLSVLYTQVYHLYIKPADFGNFKDKSVKLTGIVITEPEFKRWQTDVVVKVEEIRRLSSKVTTSSSKKQRVRGMVLVKIRFPKRDTEYGERYCFSGVLRVPEDSKYKGYLKRRGIGATMNVWDRKRIQYIGREPPHFLSPNPLTRGILRLKGREVSSIKEYLSPPYSQMLIGMILKKGTVPKQIREIFMRIGVVHILAISGLHVGIMSGIFLLLFRLLNLPKRVSFGITFILVILYALITGLGAPVVRTALMVNIFLLGYIIRRRTNIFVTLAVSSLLILLWSPYYLFDIGFQLSFVTVLCIILITPRLEEKVKIRRIWPVRIFLVSIAASIGSLPLVAYYFNYISWIGPLSNLVVIPLFTLILTFGFILLISVWISPFLSHLIATVVKSLLLLLLKIAETLSASSLIYTELPPIDLTIPLLYYLILFLLLSYSKLRKLMLRIVTVGRQELRVVS